MRDLYTGIFYVNAPTIGAEVHLPFGGTKHTGNGHREAGVAALDVFSEWKSIYIDFSSRLQRAQIDVEEFSRRVRVNRPTSSSAHRISDSSCETLASGCCTWPFTSLLGWIFAGTFARTIHLRQHRAAPASRGDVRRHPPPPAGVAGRAAALLGCLPRRPDAVDPRPHRLDSRPGRGRPPSWVQWHTMFSLCGGLGPLVAFLARPHRGARETHAAAAAVELVTYGMFGAFVYAYFLLVPSVVPHRGPAEGILLWLVQLQRLLLVAAVATACGSAARRRGHRRTCDWRSGSGSDSSFGS